MTQANYYDPGERRGGRKTGKEVKSMRETGGRRGHENVGRRELEIYTLIAGET